MVQYAEHRDDYAQIFGGRARGVRGRRACCTTIANLTYEVTYQNRNILQVKYGALAHQSFFLLQDIICDFPNHHRRDIEHTFTILDSHRH